MMMWRKPHMARINRRCLAVERVAFENARMQGVWCPVASSSMVPSLLAGDEVLLVPALGVRAGDVVVVRRSAGGLLLHRVVAVTEGGVVTRGDACQRNDPAAPRRAVLMKALHRRRNGLAGPIPRRGWRVALRRWRSSLRRLLDRPLVVLGRSSRARR
jgi:hypothetical protein